MVARFARWDRSARQLPEAALHPTSPSTALLPFFVGGGAAGQLLCTRDWTRSPLGDPARWPQSLRTALSICLPSAIVSAIYWGPELVILYNDAYAPVLTDRHPWALGRPFREVWPELRDVLGPKLADVWNTGEGFSAEDQKVALLQHGQLVDSYWSYNFAPIRGEAAAVAGVFLTATDNTARVRSQRDQAALLAEKDSLLQEKEALDVARAEGEALRTALLTSLGHDLRTPLTAIRVAAETLRTVGPALSDTTRGDLLCTIEEETNRLSRWMSSILELVRLEAGELRPRRVPVDLTEALVAVCEWAGRAHPGRCVEILPAAHLSEPALDPALLSRVLENLVDNALKYAPAPSAVRLSARCDGTLVTLEVEDDGPGIPTAELPRVFDPFFRARRTDSVAAGSGLGLAICKGLTEAMGGSIEARSPMQDGRGTRVTLNFAA